jgi:hypothetical protein
MLYAMCQQDWRQPTGAKAAGKMLMKLTHDVMLQNVDMKRGKK